MKILETTRLILREIVESDAEFLLDLLNQPSFIKYIGDRGVRTVEDSVEFINTRYRKSYEDNGFGLWTVELKDAPANTGTSDNTPIGICGLVKRDSLPEPDIGFAFLPAYWGKGYALESAQATLYHARDALDIKHLLAITTPDNESSRRLLEKIGFKFDEIIDSADGAEKLNLFSWKAAQKS